MAPTRRTFLGTATAVTTLALAGCATGNGGGGETTTRETTQGTTMDGTTTSGTTMDGSATVQVSSHESLGEVLVGPDGMTLYMFDSDTQGESASTCYDDCASAWPPLTSSDPAAGDGVTAELSTFERDDGSMQVAANGWPLYYYTPDEEPGDVTGQGVNGVWWVLRPDGTVVRNEGTTTSDGGGTATSDGEGTTTNGGGGGDTTTSGGSGPDY